MANHNKVQLIGRLTKDPELRHTTNGTAVTEISLAINREFNTADGSRRKEACFVDVVFWARKAEVIAEYCKTGSELFIEGRLELDQWENSETGQKRSRLRVVCEGFQFLDKGRRENGDGDGDGDKEVTWEEAAAGVSDEPVPVD
jgi:single-strand DNA-binding protein